MPRISQLPSLATADNADEIAIVDVSASTTKKITRGDLLKAPLPTNSVTTAAIADSAVTAAKIDFTTGIWWEELGRATNSVASTANLVVNIPVEKRRKYYKIIVAFERATTGSVTYPMVQINNDAGSNYQTRAIISSIASGTGLENQKATITNVGEVELAASVGAGGRIEVEISRGHPNGWYLFFCHCASDTYVKTGGGRWQSSAPITSFRFAPNGVNMTAGTEIVVLGHN